ncbi:5'-3' exoribonuclease 3 [Spatholobus suberectus]|nr:5'-3' exoribonuclease 3 [Spatholobus suberectus]
MSQPSLSYDVLGRRRKSGLLSFVLVSDNFVFLCVCNLVLRGIEDNWRSDLSRTTSQHARSFSSNTPTFTYKGVSVGWRLDRGKKLLQWQMIKSKYCTLLN